MRLEDETLAIVTLSRTADCPFTSEDIESLEKMPDPFAPALRLIDRSGRTVLQHVLEDGE